MALIPGGRRSADRLSAVKRPFAHSVLFAITAVALTGCATFTDGSLSARVGDDELTDDQLTSITRELLGDDEAVRADMQAVIGVLNNWVLDRVLRADLAAAGAPIDDVEGELTNESLTASVTESFTLWQQTPPTPIPNSEVRAHYELGPVESNIICTAHVLVDDEATADEVLERLEGGDGFAEVAAEYSFDTTATNGGNLPCGTTTDFAAQYVPEYVEAALAAEIGVPVGPVLSQFGYHVILVRPFDEVAQEELDGVLATPQLRFDFASSNLDVYVDPRYGSFNASSGIVPLG